MLILDKFLLQVLYQLLFLIMLFSALRVHRGLLLSYLTDRFLTVLNAKRSALIDAPHYRKNINSDYSAIVFLTGITMSSVTIVPQP